MCVALHEREGLRNGVVNAGCDLRALLEANPFEVLAPQLPDPRPEHEQERAHQGAGPDERVRRADVTEQRHRADHHQDDREFRQGPALAHRAAAHEDHAEARDDQSDADHGAARKAEREQQ